jgi:tRNA 2-selenouridine synthase SelU
MKKKKNKNPFNLYEKFSNPKQLKVAEDIQRLRLQLIVHSCIYYNMNSNIITDKQWDALAKKLVRLQKKYPKTSAEVVFAKAFEGFDGSTGFDLPLEHKWVKRKAQQLLHMSVQNK